jgi:hypothetical protein
MRPSVRVPGPHQEMTPASMPPYCIAAICRVMSAASPES